MHFLQQHRYIRVFINRIQSGPLHYASFANEASNHGIRDTVVGSLYPTSFKLAPVLIKIFLASITISQPVAQVSPINLEKVSQHDCYKIAQKRKKMSLFQQKVRTTLLPSFQRYGPLCIMSL